MSGQLYVAAGWTRCTAVREQAGDGAVGTMTRVAEQIGAAGLRRRGLTGAGVTVAVLDSGVADTAELSGAVVAAVDLSVDAWHPERSGRDLVGHGTHLAGIIAGRRTGDGDFEGVAPGAGIVAVKVGAPDGSVHPAHIIRGIDWVVDHRDEFDIRVLNIAFAADSMPGSDEALARAVRRAWAAGIVVVVAAGNNGEESGGLSHPASSPHVIAVGTAVHDGTSWEVFPTSSSGDGVRNPDVVAPGRSIVSVLSPGSLAGVEHPESVVDGRYIKGTGSSQAAAVVSGAVALLLQACPELSPDEVKAVLAESAVPLPACDEVRAGAGLIDLEAAISAVPEVIRPIECSWAGSSWAGSSWAGSSWAGSSWAGSSWAGSSWAGSSWAGSSWA